LQAAIDAIDASADFINENKRVIAVPVLYFLPHHHCSLSMDGLIVGCFINEQNHCF